MDYPVKKKAKERRIEKRTILRFCDNEEIAIRKRPGKGLLAGLYEFPNVEGHLTQKEVIEYAKESGLTPVRVKKLPKAKHIFSHVEWHMGGYFVSLKEMPESLPGEESGPALFLTWEEIRKEYPVPNAFAVYKKYLDQRYGGEEE